MGIQEQRNTRYGGIASGHKRTDGTVEQRISGYTKTEQQWVHRNRGIRGTEERRNTRYRGTVGQEV